MADSQPDLLQRGFEQGPIRPPSEAYSLLVRVTRNCPWNKCRFCPVYKGEKFSRREPEEVILDIDVMRAWYDELKARSWRLGLGGRLDPPALQLIYQEDSHNPYLYSLILFQLGGGKTAFLQDADSVIIRTEKLVKILKHLRQRFPSIERITSYSRTRTIARKPLEELKAIRKAGLDRLHLGLESGSDRVLEWMQKGATQKEEIEAGQKAKEAGFELSEYVMPGLGGKKLSNEHSLETARAINQINPDFIRLRSLGIPPTAPLYQMYKSGEFQPLNDIEMVQEIKLLIENLEGITSYLVSDHILNLLGELEGKFPEDKSKLLKICERFLSLSEKDQLIFIIGRRSGMMETLDDLINPERRAKSEMVINRLGLKTPEQAQELVQKIVEKFI